MIASAAVQKLVLRNIKYDALALENVKLRAPLILVHLPSTRFTRMPDQEQALSDLRRCSRSGGLLLPSSISALHEVATGASYFVLKH